MNKKIISQSLNKAGIKNIIISAVEELRGSGPKMVFKFKNNNSFYILKIFNRSSSYNPGLTNKKFYKLANKKVSVPKFLYADNYLPSLPRPWILYEWISGKLLHQLKSKNQKYEYAVQAGINLRKIHETQLAGFGWLKPNNTWSGKSTRKVLNFFVKRINCFVARGYSPFTNKELNKIFNKTAHHKNLLSFKKPRLLHGDITGGNIIITKQNKIYFFDPGEIIAGDPMADLGYSQTSQCSPEFQKGVWEGYTKKQPLNSSEYNRFLRWQLLRQCVITCRAASLKNKKTVQYIRRTKKLSESIFLHS